MGSIGVRCSKEHRGLWFHLDVKIAHGSLYPPFLTDGSDREHHALLGLRHPWNGLTTVGSRIVLRVLAIPGVTELSARWTYFDLGVASEELWRTVLPEVVRIIREETDDPQASVVVRPNDHDAAPVPQWHEPLLHELFN